MSYTVNWRPFLAKRTRSILKWYAFWLVAAGAEWLGASGPFAFTQIGADIAQLGELYRSYDKKPPDNGAFNVLGWRRPGTREQTTWISGIVARPPAAGKPGACSRNFWTMACNTPQEAQQVQTYLLPRAHLHILPTRATTPASAHAIKTILRNIAALNAGEIATRAGKILSEINRSASLRDAADQFTRWKEEVEVADKQRKTAGQQLRALAQEMKNLSFDNRAELRDRLHQRQLAFDALGVAHTMAKIQFDTAKQDWAATWESHEPALAALKVMTIDMPNTLPQTIVDRTMGYLQSEAIGAPRSYKDALIYATAILEHLPTTAQIVYLTGGRSALGDAQLMNAINNAIAAGATQPEDDPAFFERANPPKLMRF